MIRLLLLTIFIILLYLGFTIVSAYDTTVHLQFLRYNVTISSFFLIAAVIIGSVIIALISKLFIILLNAPSLISSRIKTSKMQHNIRQILDSYSHAMAKDYDGARNIINRIKNDLPHEFDVHPHMILSKVDLNPEQRTYHLRYLLDSTEYKAFAAKELARYFLGHKYHQQALEYAEQAEHMRSNDPELLALLLELYAAMIMWDQFEEAVARLQILDHQLFEQMQPQISDLYFAGAKAALAEGSDDDAIYYLEEALLHKPDSAEAASLLCPLLINRGQNGRSIEFLEAAFAATPSFELFELYAKSSTANNKEIYAKLGNIADPRNNVGLFIAIATYLGLTSEAKELVEHLRHADLEPALTVF